MTEREQEKKNERIAFITSTGVSAVVVLLMFIIVAWRVPDPPLPEYGIELNFGLDMQGSGEVQPETPVGSEGTQQEEPQQQEEATPEAVKEKVEEAAPVEEEIVSKVESPIKAKEVKEETKVVEKPKEKPVEPKKEEKPKEEVKVAYKANTQKTDSENKTTDGKEGTAGSHGDDKNKTGDKGNPQGSLDAKSLYGQPGGGGGGVSMSGFTGFEWPKVQTPSMPEEAYGVYEFLVKVDDQGDVVSVTPLQRGLSLEAERKLKEMIQKLVFIPKGSNLPAQSEGKITFKVVSK